MYQVNVEKSRFRFTLLKIKQSSLRLLHNNYMPKIEMSDHTKDYKNLILIQFQIGI
jgi:hypothetical protein